MAIYEVALKGTWQGQNVATVVHCTTEAPTQANFDTFARRVAQMFYEVPRAHLDNGLVMSTWSAREIEVTPSQYEGTLQANASGASASIPTPTQVAMVITTRTGYAGRRKRGRHYIPGLTSDKIEQDGTITPAVAAVFQSACDAFIADTAGNKGNCTWVVWSKVNGEFRNEAGELTSVSEINGATAITNCLVRTIPAVQRRRRIGVGN